MAILYRILAGMTLAVIAGLIAWFRLHKGKRDTPAEPEQPVRAGTEDIDLAIHDAETQLAAAKLSVGSKVGNLPVYLLAGDCGVSKTSVMLQSGIEPELLAGQVYDNDRIVPTRTVNIWFGTRSLFVEAGGKLLTDPEIWKRLLRRLAPRAPLVGKSQRPPRAAIVFYDCENFLRPEAQVRARDEARTLRGHMATVSQVMGSNLPVYVVFSKMDRLPCFAEYVTTLGDEEVHQVFGATLPTMADRVEGVYAETQTARLTNHFDQLFCSLADARPKFLARENDPTKLPPTYEFPREFRKIRPAAVQFLVELCRPSHLTVGPFLRGFYFTGMRPVAAEDDAAVRSATASAEIQEAAGATQILQQGAPMVAPQAYQPVMHSANRQTVSQRVFLRGLFRHVILADPIGRAASKTNLRANAKLRLLLASAGILSLLLTSGFTMSFIHNHELTAEVQQSVAVISSGDSAEPVTRLETLRQVFERLVTLHREGPPWSYRFGLYTGNELYPAVRRLYYERFQETLLERTQKAIVETLRGLPGTPGADYGPTYDALKAYLITTSNHDKSTRMFLTPVLVKWWTHSSGADPQSQVIARKQFEFYADELKKENPFSAENDSAAIEKARRYLAAFAGTDRVYAFMLADAARQASAINFNRQYPESVSVVTETHEIPGAFTKAGWQFMKDALEHPDRYISGERWVLGDMHAAALDSTRLFQDLRNRYNADFVREWRLYIKSAAVVPFGDLKDATTKLGLISGNQSPLLSLLALASRNTGVDDPAVATVFQPVQAVVLPGSDDRYVSQTNQSYVNALVTLQASLENMNGQGDDAATAQALNNALQAKVVTRQMAQSFRLDNDGHVEASVEKLLEDPILSAEQALHGAVPAGMNAGGKALCTQLRVLNTKFPFNPNSKTDVAVEELNGIFRKPDGALWAFYDKSLKKALTRQGNQYMPSGAVPLDPHFVSFFNIAAALSDALYSQGATDPAFTFSVKPGMSEGVQGITLNFDGQMLAYTGGSPPQSKSFTWQASAAHDTTVNVRVGGTEFEWQHHTGSWGALRFFAEAKHTAQFLEWPVGAGSQQFKADGKPVTVRLEVDLGALGALLQNGMACVAEVTH